jgi:phosphoribosylformylglycinamidine cyclo-ligase
LRWSGLGRDEAFRVFNLGIGMVLVLAAEHAEALLDLLPQAVVIGRLVERQKGDPPVQIIFPEKP